MKGKSVIFSGTAVVLTAALLLAGSTGCQNGFPRGSQMRVADPLEGQAADLTRSAEEDLVEQMAHHRASYERTLQVLLEFYDQQGNHLKAGWVEQEMEHLKSGPQRQYLVVAEVAGPDLQAKRTILEADILYEEGLTLKKQGKGLFGFLPNSKTESS